MQINKNSNTNFTGAFIINTKNNQIKEAIPAIIKKGRQIFYDIKNEGDVVLVTKNKYDYRVKDFIESHYDKLKFEYYPEISTKSGLDDEFPAKLKQMLNIKNNCVISNLKLLNKFLQKNKLHLSKQCENLYDAINTLRLNIENPKIEINDNGFLVIRDNNKKRTIKSTGFYRGSGFVHVIPDSPILEAKKYIFNRNGKGISKEYSTPREMLRFLKHFKKAMEAE